MLDLSVDGTERRRSMRINRITFFFPPPFPLSTLAEKRIFAPSAFRRSTERGVRGRGIATASRTDENEATTEMGSIKLRIPKSLGLAGSTRVLELPPPILLSRPPRKEMLFHGDIVSSSMVLSLPLPVDTSLRYGTDDGIFLSRGNVFPSGRTALIVR